MAKDNNIYATRSTYSCGVRNIHETFAQHSRNICTTFTKHLHNITLAKDLRKNRAYDACHIRESDANVARTCRARTALGPLCIVHDVFVLVRVLDQERQVS
jgi:hypothetical protein